MAVCFLSSSVYRVPLDPTVEAKFVALKALAPVVVIGFSPNLRPQAFTQHARFVLLPRPAPVVLRHLTLLVGGVLAGLWAVIRGGVRVLIAQSPYEGAAGAVIKGVARRLGYRVALVIESHGDFELAAAARTPPYAAVLRRTVAFALARADLMRAVSEATRVQLARWAPSLPQVVFPAWTNLEVFLTQVGRDEQRRAEIIFAGSVVPVKGVHVLLRAFAALAVDFPSIRLRIIGPQSDRRYLAALQEQAHQLGVRERITFDGPVSQQVLARRLAEGQIVVAPSLSEGLGRVVLEAMAAGTPVIASRVGGIPELIVDGETGLLVPPDDAVVLATRMRYVLEHPDEAEAMARRARAEASRRFTTEDYARAYQTVVARAEQVLSTHSAHAAPGL